MTSPFAVAYGQNLEDVVLHRALRDVERGFYVEVGANDPTEMSISRAFYDAGWRGIEIEPVPQLAEQFAAARPRDTVVHAAVTSAEVDTVELHWFEGTGLSTLDDAVSARHEDSGRSAAVVAVPARSLQSILDEHAPETVHFMVVDTEGTEADVLASVDLTRWRPWILVIEATQPLSNIPSHQSWEPGLLAAGYQFCLFDGISRFYVAQEHADRLGPALGFPANVLDGHTPLHWHQREQVFARALADLDRSERLVAELREQLVRWRGTVLARWATATAGGSAGGGAPTHEVVRLREELEAHRATLSWRVTAPLRNVQRRRLGGRR